MRGYSLDSCGLEMARWRGRYFRISDTSAVQALHVESRNCWATSELLGGSSPLTVIQRQRLKPSACEEIKVLPGNFYRD